MTRQETGIIMDILTVAYPKFYSGKDTPDMQKTLNLWADMFADDDVKVVAAAVKGLIASDTKGYPPHIGAVKEQIYKLQHPDEMTEAEAWQHIKKAISNGYYGSREEFDKLPPICQRLVGSPSQLRDWAVMDSADIDTVVASNIQRAFRTVQTREKEVAKIPNDVKAYIETLVKQYALLAEQFALEEERA